MTGPTSAPTTILWLRRDLRLGDNPALLAAARTARDRGGALLPVYVWEPPKSRAWAPGNAARWWLWRSLQSLESDLRRVGSRLLVERGDPVRVVATLAAQQKAHAVVWAAALEPAEVADDDAMEAALAGAGVRAVVVPPANLLADVLPTRSRAGRPYTVFTPFWRAHLLAGARERLETKHLHAPWLAPADALAAAGVTLGEGYPEPIVDHGEARMRALAAYDQVRAR